MKSEKEATPYNHEVLRDLTGQPVRAKEGANIAAYYHTVYGLKGRTPVSAAGGATGNKIANVAKEWARTKSGLVYKFGAKNPSSGGLDCSAFVNLVLNEATGKNGFGGTAGIMADQRLVTVPHDQIQPGDLLVRVDNPRTKKKYEGHVMIYVGNGQVIDMNSTNNGIKQWKPKETYLQQYTVRRIR